MSIKREIIIESEVKEDGRIYLNFKFFKGETVPSRLELLSIMTHGLGMSIRIACEELEYEKQGEIITDVFNALKKDLFDTGSFGDLMVNMEEL